MPVPEINQLPGPQPQDTEVVQRYICLMERCTARDPRVHPSFVEVLRELHEMCTTEAAEFNIEQRQQEVLPAGTRESSLMS